MSPCLRCGDFVASPVVEDVPFCAKCLEAGWDPTVRFFLPPRELWWKQLAVPIGLMALGLGGGPVVTLYLGVSGTAIGGAVVGGAVFGFLAMVPLTVVAVFLLGNRGYAGYRSRVVERLPMRAEGFRLAFLTPHATMQLVVREIGDLGLVRVTSHGLVYCGQSGTRLAIARDAIASVGCERIWSTAPPRFSLALALKDGRKLWIAFLDGGSYRANAQAATDASSLLTG